MAPLLPANADRTGPRRARIKTFSDRTGTEPSEFKNWTEWLWMANSVSFLCSQMPFLAMKNVHNIRCLRCLLNEPVATSPPSPRSTDFHRFLASELQWIPVKGCQGSTVAGVCHWIPLNFKCPNISINKLQATNHWSSFLNYHYSSVRGRLYLKKKIQPGNGL